MVNNDCTLTLPRKDYEWLQGSIASETGKSLDAWAIDSPRDAYILLLGHLDPNNVTSVRYKGKLKTSPQTRDATAKLAAYLLANELPDPAQITQEIRVEVHVYLTASEVMEGFVGGTIPIPNPLKRKEWEYPTRLMVGFTVYPQKS